MDYETALQANAPLVIGLEAAVPLLILELARLDPALRDQTRVWWAADAANEVASRGDALQYGSKKPGEAAKVFTSLAKGLAAGAYQPGGVTVFGRHWCADHAACLDADRAAAERPSLLDHNPDEPAGPTHRSRPVATVQPTPEHL